MENIVKSDKSYMKSGVSRFQMFLSFRSVRTSLLQTAGPLSTAWQGGQCTIALILDSEVHYV